MKLNEKLSNYKKLCKQTRDEDFKDFLETLPDIQSLSNFHKNMTKLKPPQINTLKNEMGLHPHQGKIQLKPSQKYISQNKFH